MYSNPPDEKRRELFHCPVQSTVRVEGKLLYVLYTEQLVYASLMNDGKDGPTSGTANAKGTLKNKRTTYID